MKLRVELDGDLLLYYEDAAMPSDELDRQAFSLAVLRNFFGVEESGRHLTGIEFVVPNGPTAPVAPPRRRKVRRGKSKKEGSVRMSPATGKSVRPYRRHKTARKVTSAPKPKRAAPRRRVKPEKPAAPPSTLAPPLDIHEDRTCPGCPLEFAYPSFLVRHLKVHPDHRDGKKREGPIVPGEVRRCPKCGRPFTRQNGYTLHLQAHEREVRQNTETREAMKKVAPVPTARAAAPRVKPAEVSVRVPPRPRKGSAEEDEANVKLLDDLAAGADRDTLIKQTGRRWNDIYAVWEGVMGRMQLGGQDRVSEFLSRWPTLNPTKKLEHVADLAPIRERSAGGASRSSS